MYHRGYHVGVHTYRGVTAALLLCTASYSNTGPEPMQLMQEMQLNQPWQPSAGTFMANCPG
jgi:hypothetical protein